MISGFLHEMHGFGFPLAQVDIRERNGAVDILGIDDVIAQRFELASAISKFTVALFAAIGGFERAAFARCRVVHQLDAGFDALTQFEISIEFFGWPEVDEFNGIIFRSNSINTTKSLYNSNGIPVDIVINTNITILKVLALTHAVRSNEDVDFGKLYRC